MFPVQFPYFKNDVESPLPEEQTDTANTLKTNKNETKQKKNTTFSLEYFIERVWPHSQTISSGPNAFS